MSNCQSIFAFGSNVLSFENLKYFNQFGNLYKFKPHYQKRNIALK